MNLKSFSSLLWVQENVEIVRSILRMQPSNEFSLACGYKCTCIFPSLPGCEDTCGFINIDYKYGSININTEFPWAPSFYLLTQKWPCLAKFPLLAFWGPQGRPPWRCHLIRLSSSSLQLPAQVGSPSGLVQNLLGGLCRAVITPTDCGCLCCLSAAELEICCLRGTFHDPVSPASPAKVCPCCSRNFILQLT